jgi:uroporphyrinogen-III decarboxylase
VFFTVMSDPNAEAEAFGMEIEYPEHELPRPLHGPLLTEFGDSKKLELPNFDACRRMNERVRAVDYYRQHVGGTYFITGWVEGPMAVYAMLRGLSNACYDFYDHGDELTPLFNLFVENAKQFITRQVDAGADCIGVGDAAASQIGPDFYRKYVLPGEKELVRHIHKLGALAKIHICGNTRSMQPDMIATGFDIIDVDHLVGSMEEFAPLLSPKQVFSGSCDPVRVVCNAQSFEEIEQAINTSWQQAGGRVITSAGCEIPGETLPRNFRWLCKAGSQLS